MMFAKFDPTNIPSVIHCGIMKLGKCYVSDVLDMNPYQEIKDYLGPVLIVHGSHDKIVKMDYITQAYEVYQKRETKSKVELHIIENANHMFSKKHDKMAIEYLINFLSDYK